jgi:hypothetical protein
VHIPTFAAKYDEMEMVCAPAVRGTHEPTPIRKHSVERLRRGVTVGEYRAEESFCDGHRLHPGKYVDDRLRRHAGHCRTAKMFDLQQLRELRKEALTFYFEFRGPRRVIGGELDLFMNCALLQI